MTVTRSLPRQQVPAKGSTPEQRSPVDAQHEHNDAVHRCVSCGQPLGYRPTVDRLTGLLDRESWDDLAPQTLARDFAQGRTTCLLFLDLDHFKQINDTYGHTAGDAVLQAVAAVLQKRTRRDDLIGRYGGHGGDEFLVLLPSSDLAGAFSVADRVRRQIKATKVNSLSVKRCPVTITELTVSIGVASASADVCGNLLDLVLDADDALLQAKRLGRDRIYVSRAANQASPRGDQRPII